MDKKQELKALLPYANTKIQKQRIKKALECDTFGIAAKELGIRRESLSKTIHQVRARAAKSGYAPEHGMTHTAPEGFHVSKVSTLHGGKSPLQWVQMKPDPNASKFEVWKEALEELCEDLRSVGSKDFPQTHEEDVHSELMTVYPIGDPHFGMMAWGKEVGEDFDLGIAESRTQDAVSRLIASGKPTAKGLMINLGDYFHADDYKNMTPRSGHILDVDSRLPKTVKAGVRSQIHFVESLLEHHDEVEVWNLPGNHDPVSAVWLAIAMSMYFDGHPRVTVRTDPGLFLYIQWGKTLIGAHHGHATKPDKLGGVMACDKPREWGATEWRYWWTGHIHSRNVWELQGCVVESARTLATADAYAHEHGYRSKQTLQAVTYHKDHGEVERHTAGISMLGV